MKRKVRTNWEHSNNLTRVYLEILNEIAASGTSFKDKNTLLPDFGKGSIGVEVFCLEVPTSSSLLPATVAQSSSTTSLVERLVMGGHPFTTAIFGILAEFGWGQVGHGGNT